MDDLLNADIQERLRLIWTNPSELDPAKRSAEVTQDIAQRLAKIAKRLESKHDAKDVAEFLMRCLFTMFAEDVELLTKRSFERLLEKLKDTPKNFVPGIENLWSAMDTGDYAAGLNETVKRFNGNLFTKGKALPLEPEEIHELWVAAKQDWRDVEPAIFGTLLENALNSLERSKLGAHFTPRVYVERLVVPTIIEPLRRDWDAAQALMSDQLAKGDNLRALRTARRFHRTLCTTRVLDPACGTGNFLYVSLELLKRLEGEVLEAIEELGGTPDRYADYPDQVQGRVGRKLTQTGGRFSVDPHQFYGLELNPRAVPIADLVLWIGYLKWQLRTGGPDAVTEPVLDAYGTIVHQDALIAHKGETPVLDEGGEAQTRWDGVTKKLHPITGEEIPDDTAIRPVTTFQEPSIADWPEVEFIVGNPPFIGGKDMRRELGDGYAEACWAVRPKVPGGADFVMHFWDMAAQRLSRKGTAKHPNPLRRFGFITTNSITQTFSRRVIETAMNAKTPLSLVYAISDHPWMKGTGRADVRIAMTVAEAGNAEGTLAKVVSEEDLNTDAPKVELEKAEGKVKANFTLGADLSKVKPLWANTAVGHKGFMPYGMAFWVNHAEAKAMGLGKYQDSEKHIRLYINGRDLNNHSRSRYALDFHQKDEEFVRKEYPEAYQHLLANSKPVRAHEKIEYRRKHWWRFGQPSTEMRAALVGLGRFFATTETAAHRIFSALDGREAPDQKIRVISIQNWKHLAALSSRVHVEFSFRTGGWQGVGNDPVYQHTNTFNPFPFPPFADLPDALTQHLETLGERLDTFRKERLNAHDHLTMTGLYNALERLRELENGADVPAISDAEKDTYEAGHIQILKEIHDNIDRATLKAYGWSDLAPRLVGKPGATTPSPHKSEDQEQAEEELLSRLLDLNQERAAEEARGDIRWLRPDYQIPKLRHKAPQPEDGQQLISDLVSVTASNAIKWPSDAMDQIKLLQATLNNADGPLGVAQVSSQFKGGKKRGERIANLLRNMVEIGIARSDESELGTTYFVPR